MRASLPTPPGTEGASDSALKAGALPPLRMDSSRSTSAREDVSSIETVTWKEGKRVRVRGRGWQATASAWPSLEGNGATAGRWRTRRHPGPLSRDTERQQAGGAHGATLGTGGHGAGGPDEAKLPRPSSSRRLSRDLTVLASSTRRLAPAATASAATLAASPTVMATVSKKGALPTPRPSFLAPAHEEAAAGGCACVWCGASCGGTAGTRRTGRQAKARRQGIRQGAPASRQQDSQAARASQQTAQQAGPAAHPQPAQTRGH